MCHSVDRVGVHPCTPTAAWMHPPDAPPWMHPPGCTPWMYLPPLMHPIPGCTPFCSMMHPLRCTPTCCNMDASPWIPPAAAWKHLPLDAPYCGSMDASLDASSWCTPSAAWMHPLPVAVEVRRLVRILLESILVLLYDVPEKLAKITGERFQKTAFKLLPTQESWEHHTEIKNQPMSTRWQKATKSLITS